MSDNTPTFRDLVTVLQGWLKETVQQELQRAQPHEEPQAALEQMLNPRDPEAKEVRARRYREALAGLEGSLLDQPSVAYRGVLNLVTHNIGASLQELGLLQPEQGIADPQVMDFRRHSTFPALVALRRYVALPRTTRAMQEVKLDQFWPASATLFLAEYRQWQPRYLRAPAHDEFHFGLFAWNLANPYDLCFMPVASVPGAQHTGSSEIALLRQRLSMLARWLDSGPNYEQHIVRMTPRAFVHVLRALLLDYEALHTQRQREVAEEDQFGALLWEFLSRDD